MNRRARGRIGGREAVVCARRTVNTPQPPQGGAGSAARLAALSFASHFMPRKNRAVRKEQENHQRSFRRVERPLLYIRPNTLECSGRSGCGQYLSDTLRAGKE